MPDPRRVVSCLRCGGTWTGFRRCHCGSCHLNFSSVTSFHRHRKDFACLAPASRGLVLVNGYWSLPGNRPQTSLNRRSATPGRAKGLRASTADPVGAVSL